MKFNSDEYLAVVAYADKIENKEEFAEKVISMCRENSFKKIKFTGKPISLRISVYCWEEDIGKKEKEFEIEYLPKEPIKKYNITDNPEGFELYIDGVLVENKNPNQLDWDFFVELYNLRKTTSISYKYNVFVYF